MRNIFNFHRRFTQPIGASVFVLSALTVTAPAARAQVLFQQFTYPTDTPPDGLSWWRMASRQMPALARLGVWGVWHPVPVKGGSGQQSMGYDPYDLYDLGSKNQKGTVATRFGTKADYLSFIAVAHANGLRVISDVVLNHTGGADQLQENPLMAQLNMNDVPDPTKVPAQYLPSGFDFSVPHHLSWTSYRPIGASGMPGTGRFPRDLRHFHPSAVHPDRKEPYHKNEFLEDYCHEADNFYVARNLENWGIWFRNQTDVDGFRLDAIKIVEPSFLDGFARKVSYANPQTKAAFWTVGEFWDTNPKLLSDFQQSTHNQIKLFDFGLFYALWDMTEKPIAFDMRDLLKRRLPTRDRAVSFVSNHDVDRFQPINRQKRALPYAITLAMDGQPSIFYRDYFGAEDKSLPASLETLVGLHNRFAVGQEIVRLADKSALVIEREKNLLACFNSGGDSNAARTLSVPTAWGPSTALRAAASSPGAATQNLQTNAQGQVTVSVPAGGFVWLVRADASERTNPDRFAPRPLPTTQTWEFADDLETGELGKVPQRISVDAAAGSPLRAQVKITTKSAGQVRLVLLAPSGRVVVTTLSASDKTVHLAVGRLPEAGTYQLVTSFQATEERQPQTARGTLQISYSAPARQ